MKTRHHVDAVIAWLEETCGPEDEAGLELLTALEWSREDHKHSEPCYRCLFSEIVEAALRAVKVPA